MSEEKKQECGTSGSCGCCCGSVKKIILAIVLILIVFTCGYIYGKGGGCPMGTAGSKMCPLPR